MTKRDKQILVKFIKDNGLAFQEGRRNSDSCIFAGFALYMGFDTSNEGELIACIEEACSPDSGVDQEFSNVLEYAEMNSYENYWSTPAAATTYKF